MNTVFVNKYNGALITCDEHREAQLKYIWGPFPYEVTVPAELHPERGCKECWNREQHNNQPQKMKAALTSPDHSHTRWINGYVYAYHRDAKSPTGVLLSCSLDEARYNTLVKELGLRGGSFSPLSPTEGR